MRILLILTILLLSSCGVKSKLDKNSNSLVVKRIGILDSATVNVTGIIIEKHNKLYLPGVAITLKNVKNEYSKIADLNGEFSFKHINSGKYEIISSISGYYMLRDSIEFKSGEIVKLKIGLRIIDQ